MKLTKENKIEMINFINKLSTGLGKVDTHFITDMVNGIISNNSINIYLNIKTYDVRIEKSN